MIELTQEAVQHIKKSLVKRGSGLGIRLGVRTTGCSGMAYVLEFVDSVDPSDVEIAVEGFSVYIDPKSLSYLTGIVVEYEKTGLQEGLKFSNPNEVSRCGCGESFSV